MHIWPIYALLTAIMLWVAFTRGGENIRVMGVILAVTWLVSNASHWFLPPDTRVLLPIMDFSVGVGLLMVWGRDRHRGLLVVSALFLVQCVAHVIYQNAPIHDFATRWRYDFSLNFGYLLQLGVVVFDTFTARTAVNLRSEKM